MTIYHNGKRRRSDGSPTSDFSKRPRTSQFHANQSRNYDDYTVGVVTPLSHELAAFTAMLDKVHTSLPRLSRDSNSYTLGNIGCHNIVVACLPSGHYGTINAATVASDMRRSYPSIQTTLLVGIGGAIPETADIRLGDVVVGRDVIDYTFGKTEEGGFRVTSNPVRPPPHLLTALSNLESKHIRGSSRLPSILASISETDMRIFGRPSVEDRLYSSRPIDGVYEVQSRPSRPNSHPKVHVGTIASGNQVMKDALERARVAENHKAKCFEMEGAGLCSGKPALVIRGISDYSDCHKNDEWQNYAAATAAACAKELLLLLPSTQADSNLEMATVVYAGEQQAFNSRFTVLKSLEFEDMDTRYETIQPAYTKTCKWLLDHHQYLKWQDHSTFGDHYGLFWIYGKPGAGKSTLMKYAFEMAQRNKNKYCTAISFFFNARGAQLERSTEGMYRSLLAQIFKAFPDLTDLLDPITIAPDEDRRISWKLPRLKHLFRKVVGRLESRRLTCFIDALDECRDGQIQEMVDNFDELGQIACENGTRLYACFSSRHFPHVAVQNGIKMTLETQPGHKTDMEQYVQRRITHIQLKPIKQQVIPLILGKWDGVFLWVVLVVEILNKEIGAGRTWRLLDCLRRLPPKLSDLFKDVLRRDKEDWEEFVLCMQWMLYSAQPLRAKELCSALQPELLDQYGSVNEWDAESMTFDVILGRIRSASKGLAEVNASKTNPTVQFIHESVRDFLVTEDEIRELWPHSANFETSSHDKLKECCARYCHVSISEKMPENDRYLVKTTQKEKEGRRSEISKRFPLLSYASTHVLFHANAAGKPDAAGNHLEQKDFLLGFARKGWIRLRNLFGALKRDRYSENATLEYICSDRNFHNLLRDLLQDRVQGYSPALEIGETHKYPVIAALARGHRETFAMLFKGNNYQTEVEKVLFDIDPLEFDREVELSLHGAPRYKTCPGAIGALRQSVPNLNKYNETVKSTLAVDLLHSAVSEGHVAVVKMLLLIGIDFRRVTGGLSAVLSKAMEKKKLDVVRVLLCIEGAKINLEDAKGRTLLSHAAELDEEGTLVSRMLGMPDIIVDSRDISGRTPLSYAAGKGREIVVRLLLDTAKADSRDRFGRTPLSHAAGEGREAVVRLLVDVDEVDVNSRDRSHRSPLSRAASLAGNENIVNILLQQPGIQADKRCRHQRQSPLSYAAAVRLNENTVRLLLSTPGVKADSRDRFDRTPLSHAAAASASTVAGHPTARRGNEATVGLLLQQTEVKPDSIDNEGRTPLSYAAAVPPCNEKTMKLLLEHGAKADSKDHKRRSPLSYAAENEKNLEAVKLLLERRDVDPFLKDKTGKSPWDHALKLNNGAILDVFRSRFGQY